MNYQARLERLDSELIALGRVAVAFSGGVDSAALLHAARRVLGEGAAAVIADSPSLPRAELIEARALAARMDVPLVELRTDELENPGYVANTGDRCYYCKSALFEEMRTWASSAGYAALAFGEITDDLLDDRPGARAAREFEVRAPLRDAGFDKQDVRRYAREAGLAVADKPASACLASRLPIGTEVTPERLATVERAEALVRERGYRVLRVRHHGQHALLEVGEDEIVRARGERTELDAALASCGFETTELGVYISPVARGRTAVKPPGSAEAPAPPIPNTRR